MRRGWQYVAVSVGALALAPYAQTQEGVLRAAVSPALTPAAAQEAFIGTVLNGCISAVAGGARLSAVPGAGLSANADADTRRQAGAAAEDSVYDVVSARGVVTAHDREGRCVVTVYGPAAAPSVMSLAQRLAQADQGFERLAAAPAPTGLGASLFKVAGDKRIQVVLSGSEPGMPGHQSRFSVVTATVFATPAR